METAPICQGGLDQTYARPYIAIKKWEAIDITTQEVCKSEKVSLPPELHIIWVKMDLNSLAESSETETVVS